VRALLAFFLFVALAMPLPARADAIDSPPSLCPPGICNADSDCSVGRVCRPQDVCFEERTAYRAPPGTTFSYPVNMCAPTSPCAAPRKSQPAHVCVPPGQPTPQAMPVQTDGTINNRPPGCACRITDTTEARGLPLAALAIGLVSLRRSLRSRR